MSNKKPIPKEVTREFRTVIQKSKDRSPQEIVNIFVEKTEPPEMRQYSLSGLIKILEKERPDAAELLRLCAIHSLRKKPGK